MAEELEAAEQEKQQEQQELEQEQEEQDQEQQQQQQQLEQELELELELEQEQEQEEQEQEQELEVELEQEQDDDADEMETMVVGCPDGCAGGDAIVVVTSWGEEVEVVVPDGIVSGAWSNDSKSGHRLLLSPADWCPVFAVWTTQATSSRSAVRGECTSPCRKCRLSSMTMTLITSVVC